VDHVALKQIYYEYQTVWLPLRAKKTGVCLLDSGSETEVRMNIVYLFVLIVLVDVLRLVEGTRFQPRGELILLGTLAENMSGLGRNRKPNMF
jgi:hypothetical protein